MHCQMKLMEFPMENSRCNSKENFNAVESYNPKIDSSVCCNPIFIMIKMLPKVMIQKLIQQYPALCGVKGNFIPHLCIAIQYS